ncbi:hypothetical protein OOT46_03885 [Aquabacterium sp. A7-Y]|uniref:hypothetical protein n=1 Tax=Aquabacterium sp. A7-Y TaxID=1349605 RepID=UPI00223E5411|nr:hypothetical protein [Aquabacterium sp. A7-Y]MCW7536994.1 hypothetical protein [Aquabacterium sp. A7-Y]
MSSAVCMPDIDPGFAAWWFGGWPGHAVDVVQRSCVARRDAGAMAWGDAALTFSLEDATLWDWHHTCRLTPDRWPQALGRFAAFLCAQTPALLHRLRSREERQWGLSMASTQPLPRRLDWHSFESCTLEALALAELSFYFDEGFPGLWARVRQGVPAAWHDEAQGLREQLAGTMAAATPRRQWRAAAGWQRCIQATLELS